MSHILSQALCQVIRCNGFPFEICLDILNEKTMEAIWKVQRIKKDPSIGKSYTNVDEMMKEVLA